jgi:3-hydroxybutyryl-CoA dehydrogenase
MESILVIGGAGFMGSGIVQACAQAGYKVFINDVDDKAIEKTLAFIEWSVKKLESKNLLKDNSRNILARLTVEKNLDIASSVDWIIETITEVEELKLSLFKKLDALAPAHVPLGTNTSTIPISRLAKVTVHPERVVGIHFFNPVPLMGLMEIIKGDATSAEMFDRATNFAKSLGKRPVRVQKDIPGFVFNRIWGGAIGQAVDLVAQGIVTADDVDFGMREGYGWKRGPFEMADDAGVDTFANGARSFIKLGEPGLAPRTTLLDDMVKQGRVGRKAGKGFYDYTNDKSKASK